MEKHNNNSNKRVLLQGKGNSSRFKLSDARFSEIFEDELDTLPFTKKKVRFVKQKCNNCNVMMNLMKYYVKRDVHLDVSQKIHYILNFQK
jgi:hypothetical protein